MDIWARDRCACSLAVHQYEWMYQATWQFRVLIFRAANTTESGPILDSGVCDRFQALQPMGHRAESERWSTIQNRERMRNRSGLVV